MKNCFGVAMRLIFVAFCFEFGAVIGVVINFTIINYYAGFIFIKHRLMSVSYVNNAQTPMSESDVFINEFAEIVRSAMRNHITHFCQNSRINGASRFT
jgi:large-conductance mechanosensitive channel